MRPFLIAVLFCVAATFAVHTRAGVVDVNVEATIIPCCLAPDAGCPHCPDCKDAEVIPAPQPTCGPRGCTLPQVAPVRRAVQAVREVQPVRRVVCRARCAVNRVQPVRRTVRYFRCRQPVRSALRRLLRR